MMMEHVWPLMALGFSFCGALIVGFNHWANLDGGRLVVLRWLGVVPLALIAFAVLPWPGEVRFYLVAAVMGVLLALSDKLLFNAASVHGGRMAALYIPIKMLLGFLLWGLLDPTSVVMLVDMPWRGALVAAGFGLCCASLFSLRKQDAGRAALVAILPVAALLALGDVAAKYSLNSTATDLWSVVGSATAFLTVTCTVGSIAGLIAKKGRFAKPTLREVVLSAAFGAILMASLSLFLATLAIAPNPGYVGAITMLSALWLAIHGYLYHKERANLWSGVILLLGAICVAVGTA